MDRKLDNQLGLGKRGEGEDEFKVKDLKNLFTSKPFMIVAFLCVLYYSAIFPFQKFSVPMLVNTLGIDAQAAADIFRWFPIGAMILTPFLGAFLDYKGRGATMLMIGAILMCVCHLVFALVPLTPIITYTAIVLLGVSFSLVPAALWPSVPKLVNSRYLGSGYSTIFWIQNIGLWAFPVIIGSVLQSSNPGVAEQIQQGVEVSYNYTVPMLLFAGLGVLAFFLAIWLKAIDKKKGYGLELPNVKK
jgi:predicted MFS family arabinose efflux permease